MVLCRFFQARVVVMINEIIAIVFRITAMVFFQFFLLILTVLCFFRSHFFFGRVFSSIFPPLDSLSPLYGTQINIEGWWRFRVYEWKEKYRHSHSKVRYCSLESTSLRCYLLPLLFCSNYYLFVPHKYTICELYCDINVVWCLCTLWLVVVIQYNGQWIKI